MCETPSSANPALEFQGTQSAQAPTLETVAGTSKARTAQANARVDIYLRQAGRDMGIARPLLSEIPVLGSSRNARGENGGFEFALRLQNACSEPLRLINDFYSFDIPLVGFQSVADLETAISRATGEE